MYSNKIVLAIKSKGKVLRELAETVYLPFGQEYSIFTKNLDHRRAAVRIWVDGAEATEGVMLIVEPNTEVELERFIKNGNLHQGNRFKFIERTAAVAAHRGVGAEDGLIKISYQFEKPQTVTTVAYPPTMWLGATSGVGGALYNSAQGATHDSYMSNASLSNQRSRDLLTKSAAGITAPGSISDQSFYEAPQLQLEAQTYTMILQLKGEHVGKYVTAPVLTRATVDCTSCGVRSKTHAKFCSECGTSLQVIN